MPNEEKRKRDWFLTINQGANCFAKIEDCLNSIIGKSDTFAYILHDKDTKSNGEATKPHYHVVLLFKNARGFNSIRKTFEGADIEEVRSLSAACNYLMHNGKPEKYHYDFSEVKSNCIEWFKNQLTEYAKEKFVEDKLLYYMYIEKSDTFLKLCQRFGASQLGYGIIAKINALQKDYLGMTDDEKEELEAILKAEWENRENEED